MWSIPCKIQRFHREFWVGSLPWKDFTRVDLVVYDPLGQSQAISSQTVRLFSAKENRISDFSKDTVKKHLGEVAHFTETQIDEVIDAYLQVAGINIEQERHDIEEAERTLATRHEAYLAHKGIQNRGMRVVSRGHRETHCYCHQAWLDSRVHMECVGCGAIICYACGGCFCGK